MKKLMIIGRPGSGKSTFAVQLANLLQIKIFHLDKYFFERKWIARDYEEFLVIQKEMIGQSSWIIDGNSTKSYAMRYACADVCIYFNVPRWLCYWRVFKRLFHKDPVIDDRAPDSPETVRWSLLQYMWNFEARVQPRLEVLQLQYPDVRFVEFRTDAEVDAFLQQQSKSVKCEKDESF